MQEKQDRKGVTAPFVLGVIVGLGLYWAIFEKKLIPNIFMQSEDTAVLEDEVGNSKADLKTKLSGIPEVSRGENILVVVEQPAGNSVTISMASLAINVWVAVHEVGEAGEAGVILGARRFTVGNYFGESIELLRNTNDGKPYRVVLHHDDGDSEFNFTEEPPLRDSEGKLVSEEFLVRSSGD